MLTGLTLPLRQVSQRSSLELTQLLHVPHCCVVLLKNKKLSYRKQIAHQLRTQYVEGIYSNSVTYKSRLDVTQCHYTIRQIA